MILFGVGIVTSDVRVYTFIRFEISTKKISLLKINFTLIQLNWKKKLVLIVHWIINSYEFKNNKLFFTRYDNTRELSA